MPSDKTIIIHPVIRNQEIPHPKEASRNPETKLEEAVGLARAIDLDVVESLIVNMQRVNPGLFLGTGKVEELKQIVQQKRTSLLIVNDHITPVQQRNIENALKCKVIDRTALILEIFGERARTGEGKLQVDLARCEYQKSRLVRSWTHLERQRGGGGVMSGPGERQIESDRRAIKERIGKIRRQLDKVVQTRELHRKARKKIPYKIIALVGYTNAGKSTLFNQVTKAKVVAENRLFSTVDPTIRMIGLPSGKEAMLSDTVGFISDLPTELVAAFRATLEEVIEADIILHVRDISHEEAREQKQDVLKVLQDLGIKNTPIIEVLNKTDVLNEAHKEIWLQKMQEPDTRRVMISALKGEGIDLLFKQVDATLAEEYEPLAVTVNAAAGKIIAWIHANTHIVSEKQKEEVLKFELRVSPKEKGILQKMIKEYHDAS